MTTTIKWAIGIASGLAAIGGLAMLYRYQTTKRRGHSLSGNEDPESEFYALIKDPDPASMDVAEDIALSNNLKLSKLAMAGGRYKNYGAFIIGDKTHISWQLTPTRTKGKWNVLYTVVSPLLVHQYKTSLQKDVEDAHRYAGARAWQAARVLKYGLAKNTPPSELNTSVGNALLWLTALRRINKTPELFGNDALTAEAQIKALMLDPDPAAMKVAEDIALQNNLKLSKISKLPLPERGVEAAGIYRLNLSETESNEVHWVVRPGANHVLPSGRNQKTWLVGYDVLWGGRPVENVRVFEVSLTKTRAMKRAAAIAWGIAKQLKRLPLDADKSRVQNVAWVAARDKRNKQPKELYGSLHNEDDPKKRFTELLLDPHPAAMDVAEDFALENGLKLSKITQPTMHFEDFSYGVYDLQFNPYTGVQWRIQQGKGTSSWNAGYSVFWQGQQIAFEPATKISRTKIQATKLAAAIAWSIAKRIKQLPSNTTSSQLQNEIWISASDPHNQHKEDLFGTLRSTSQLNMSMSPKTIKTALTTAGIPVPEGDLIDASYRMRTDDWYVRTKRGWVWWDSRARAWRPSSMGPI